MITIHPTAAYCTPWYRTRQARLREEERRQKLYAQGPGMRSHLTERSLRRVTTLLVAQTGPERITV